MARSSEKAMAMLNRWHRLKEELALGVPARRPRATGGVESVREAEKWRSQVVREATQRIGEIQNAGLGASRIRDLNDEINNLLREKSRWEERISDLGGPDYGVVSSQVVESMGWELPTMPGYKYFGAARDLPGVAELFAEMSTLEAATTKRKNRTELEKDIDPSYYGLGPEDQQMLTVEKERENELLENSLKIWDET